MLVLLCLLSLCSDSYMYSAKDIKQLKYDIFESRQYDYSIRPSKNFSEPIEIYIKFCVLGINDIDEVNQRFVTSGKLDIEWKDDYLDWNITEYNSISSLSVQHYSVWRPDIALNNGHSSTGNLHLSEFDIIVFNTGLIKWTPYSIFETKCEINTMYFPFDKQFCEVEFVLWTASAIGSRFRKAEVEVSTLHVRGEWKFVNVDASIINNGSLHKTVFKFNLQRKPGKVILEFVLPGVIISLMDLMTFCIPCGSGEKISFTTTIFLALAAIRFIASLSCS
ncbi:Hypothetical predicted protein [Mytilus galloprovincialis]|uniref:Neurotransmitter-gated ion-channel ligand-binding domain-containing protein n=1 Tax=Mytilus galloprovincialis TaxID=29158 RepID=A0A8B6HF40_MYTGA|nr:Hypothetical predicted protein [Mytilus galloprovincialis]